MGMTDRIQKETAHWDMVVTPRRKLFDLRLAEVWRYRDLIMLFVRRDFVASYKQIILGPFWYLIHPVLSAVVFTIIFGNNARLPTDGLPAFLFYMAGPRPAGHACSSSRSI
jgi:lipopolysaccharide transport system permease protein